MAEIMAVLSVRSFSFRNRSTMSLLSVMAWRLNISLVFQPPMSIIAESGTPAFRSSRAADRRKSWLFPASPALMHSVFQPLRKSFTGVPSDRVSK